MSKHYLFKHRIPKPTSFISQKINVVSLQFYAIFMIIASHHWTCQFKFIHRMNESHSGVPIAATCYTFEGGKHILGIPTVSPRKLT